MRRFRFKTEQELRDANEWAQSYEVPIGWGNNKEVLSLLGTEILDPEQLRICESGGKIFIPKDTTIATKYYVEIKEEVMIEELDRIPKEDWEEVDVRDEIIGVEMQNGNKYYLLPNDGGFIPVNLKVHRNTTYCDNTDLESGMNNCSELYGNKKVYRFKSIQEVITWNLQ